MAVFVIEKGRQAVVAALCDMVGISVSDDVSDSWHIVIGRGELSDKQLKIWGASLFFK